MTESAVEIAATSEVIGPVPGEQRITLIDCLRGWALFGILMANMRGFHAPMDAYMEVHYWTWRPDYVTQLLVEWLISGKFITIFAALFGVGFAIQMDRAASRVGGIDFYRRRLAVLFLIGLAHAFLLWWGDILTNYAICGFFLLYFRHSSQRRILIWAQVLYWFIVVMFTAFYISTLFGGQFGDEAGNSLQESLRVYAHGSVRDIFVLRFHDWVESNAFFPFLTRIVGIFLFGLYIWRQGYLSDPVTHMEWWKKAQRLGLIVGLTGNAIGTCLEAVWHASPERPNLASLLWLIAVSFGMPALSLGYVATIVRLWQDPLWQRRLMPFSYVGRMALTNYLLQSLICTTIFYSYGFGLYGRVGPLADIFLALAIYSAQVPVSRWWLTTHRYGPMEWLWRRLTYGSFRT